jgi:hypothetical protein
LRRERLIMDIKKKLEGIMKPEEIKEFETSVEKMINEQTEARVIEETSKLQKKYDVAAEEYCNKKINEGVEEAKAQLIKEYDDKMDKIDEIVEKTLDTFLESEIIPQVSDEMINKIAINEAFAPIVNGMKQLLENNFVSVDSDGSKLLTEAKNEIINLKKETSDLIAEKIQLNERLEKAATFMLINEKSEGLTENNKKRMTEMFKGKSFDEVEGRINEYVEFLVESSNRNEDSEDNGMINEDIDPENKDKDKNDNSNTEDESIMAKMAENLL